MLGARPLLLWFCAGSVSVRAASAQSGTIVGSVRDSATRRGLERAIVTPVNVVPVTRAVSDDSGRFRLVGLPLTTIALTVRRIGYFPETLSVAVKSVQPTHADFVMRESARMLAPARSNLDVLNGKMGSFNNRRGRGIGSFITREEIVSRHPASMSELLRYVTGVDVTQEMAGQPQPVHMQRSLSVSMQTSCVVQIYVDGHPYVNGNIDDFQPSSVEGVEIYRSAAEIPGEFRSRDSMCGIIALWTRDPDAASRKP